MTRRDCTKTTLLDVCYPFEEDEEDDYMYSANANTNTNISITKRWKPPTITNEAKGELP
jgi:hypothetical protein